MGMGVYSLHMTIRALPGDVQLDLMPWGTQEADMNIVNDIIDLLNNPVQYHYCISVMGNPDAGEAHDFIVTYDNRWHDTFETAVGVLWTNEGVSVEQSDEICWSSAYVGRRNPLNHAEREYVCFVIFKCAVEDPNPGFGTPTPTWNTKAWYR